MPLPRLTPIAFLLSACSDKGDDSSGGGNNLPDDCEVDICAKYKGAMPAAINAIVEQVSSDPQFEDDFAPLVARGKEAMGAFEQSFANYLGNTYGCPGVPPYEGPTMATAHTGMNITQQEYDDFLAIIATVLADAGITNDIINSCFLPALTDPGLEAQFIGH